MGKKYRDLVAQRSNAKSGSLFVLYVMASWASDKGECSLTIGHLASDTRMSDRGVQKAIKKLVEIGEIEVISAGYGATVTTRHYSEADALVEKRWRAAHGYRVELEVIALNSHQ